MRDFKITERIWAPSVVPQAQDRLKLGAREKREPRSVAVGYNWRVNQSVSMFDSLCFVSSGDLIVFQIQPSTNPEFGVLVEVVREKLEQQPRYSNTAKTPLKEMLK